MRTLMCLGLAVLIAGCVNKPGWPERDGARRLERAGYDASTVTRIVQGQDLDEELQARLEKIRNQDVGFLLARNPSLDRRRMDRLARHELDFVRAGLARNPALPDTLVAKLMADASHTVWVGLAANPSLDAETLLKLHDEKGLEWSWFAMNPACPPEIERRIRDSGEEKALYWLKRTRKSLRGWPIEKAR